MKYIILIAFVTLTYVSNAQDTIRIATTAQCGECEQKIEEALRFAKGVLSADLDIETKTATIIYQPAKTNPARLREVISKEGYDADDVPADPKAVKRLNPCCTKDGHKDH